MHKLIRISFNKQRWLTKSINTNTSIYIFLVKLQIKMRFGILFLFNGKTHNTYFFLLIY